MSRLTQLVSRAKAVGDLVTRVKQEIPKVAPLLDALQADNYDDAWQTFAEYRDVADVLAQIPSSVQPYVSVVGHYFMQALDSQIDEDAIEAFLQSVGLIPSDPD